jgi:hypothetical protein
VNAQTGAHRGSWACELHAASCTAPPSRIFLGSGLRFERDTDGLDDYVSAYFKLDEQFPFALVHYRGNPIDTTTIYFARDTKREEVPSIVNRIVDAFKLPSSAIEWISSS